jgi:type VI protein secretion system component Hcp
METNTYVRFIGTTNLFGDSKYRPSEGWIDAVEFSEGYRSLSQPGNKECSFDILFLYDRLFPKISQACASGMQIDSAVVEIRQGEKWTRYTFNDVLISSVKMGGQVGPETIPVYSATCVYRDRSKAMG